MTFAMRNFLILFAFLFCTHLSAEKADVESFFSSKEQLAESLIRQIDRERDQICVAIYSISHLNIAKALIRAFERGVQVEVIIDPQSIKTRSPIHRLVKASIPIYVWDHTLWSGDKPKARRRPLMHDKFCIFGSDKVWTGSFNFTSDASRKHRENVLLVESLQVAKDYLSEFLHMKTYESRVFADYMSRYPPPKRRKKAL